MIFKGVNIFQKKWDLWYIMDKNIQYENDRHIFFVLLMKFVSICSKRGIRLVIENPYNTSGMTYLENNFIDPTIVDRNRMLRGDYFIKPTGYWFINCEPTQGFSFQNDKKQRSIMKCKSSPKAGLCSEERSMISPDYARNFICDNIIGKTQQISQLSLF